MKSGLVFLAVLLSSFTLLNAQENNCIPLINEVAPSFTAASTTGNIKFPEDYFAKWKIIFSHPADFTSVCSTEIMELARMQDDFKKLNTQVMVISTDGLNSHIQWVHSLESIEMNGAYIPKIEFPIIADPTMAISKLYGMLDKSSYHKTVRAVFIIDDNNKIRAIIYYPGEVGRNFNEIKRVLIALQSVSEDNILTPANWMPGDDFMIPSPSTVEEAKKLENKKSDELYNKTWYMWYKKNNK